MGNKYNVVSVVLEVLGKIQLLSLGSAQARAILALILAFAEILMNYLEDHDEQDKEALGPDLAQAKRDVSINTAHTLLSEALKKTSKS